MHRDFIIQNGVLEQYNGPGGAVVIPDGVTEIGYPAFRNCTSLTSVVIPKTVVQLNKFAFSGCTGLTRVEIAPGNKCFHIENGLVIAPKRRTLLFALAGLTSAVLPASVTIPEGVAEIGWYAFSGCTGLTSVTIPSSMTEISNYAFSGCTNLASVTIPEGVTKIDGGAFGSCASLTSVTLPASVKKMDQDVFWRCKGRITIHAPAGSYAQQYAKENNIRFEEA